MDPMRALFVLGAVALCCACEGKFGSLRDREPKGACWEIASKDHVACASNDKLRFCFVNVKADLLPFYRGACRDGGDWANAGSAPSADAGAQTSGMTSTDADG
jgi:hypothetical protein